LCGIAQAFQTSELKIDVRYLLGFAPNNELNEKVISFQALLSHNLSDPFLAESASIHFPFGPRQGDQKCFT
jgi:hypothetical protein